MKLKNIVLSAIAATLIVVGMGNSKAEASENGILGIIIGGATGGFIGSNIGKGKGQLAATAAGVFLGAAIGNEMGKNTYRHNTVYNPQNVYEPPARPRYRPVYNPEPVYTPERHRHRNKVVVHKHKVVVKHIYVDQNKRSKKFNKKHYRKKQEKRRRALAQACYENPRRCAQAF